MWGCWAAVGESWLRVLNRGRRDRQDELIDQFSSERNDGLRPNAPQFADFARYIGMDYAAVPGSRLTAELIERKLRSTGYLFIAYNRGENDSHAILVYGIENHEFTAGLPVLSVACMNPERGAAPFIAISFLFSINSLLVGWPGSGRQLPL